MSSNHKMEQHPYDIAGWLSRITVLFHFDFMWKGYTKQWNIGDMSDAPNCTKIDINYNIDKYNNIWKLVFHLNKSLWIKSAFCYFAGVLLSMVSVFVFAAIMNILMHNESLHVINIVYYCVLFLFIELARPILSINHWKFIIFGGLKTRNIVMKLMLEKIVTVFVNESTGKVLNGISTDCERLYHFVRYAVCVPLSVILILVSFPIYVYIIGYEAVFGYIVLLIIVPIVTTYTAHKQKQYLVHGLRYGDKRLKLLNEMIFGIRIVKMYAWEIPIIQQMKEYRKKEVKYYQFTVFMKIISFVFNNITEALAVSVMIIAQEFILNKPIDFVGIYTMYLLMKALRYPVGHFLQHYQKIVDGLVSIKRIQQILDYSENIYNPIYIQNNHENATSILIQMQNITFQHASDNADNKLYCGNLAVKRGEFVAVIGSLATGKSSLIIAILGEKYMCCNNTESFTKIFCKDIKYGYVGHNSFIINGTIQENIVMDQIFDANVYNSCIDACALKHDIDLLPGAHQTEIGEKGINISGGQKARVCIARNIYRYLMYVQNQLYNGKVRNTYFLLFDDPLSALDRDTALHIFNHAILGLCTGATIIMSLTSHLSLLGRFDRVIVMNSNDNKCYIDYDCVINDDSLKLLRSKYGGLLDNKVMKNGEDKIQMQPKTQHLMDLNAVKEQKEQQHVNEDDENVELLKPLENVVSCATQEDRARGSVSRISLKQFVDDGYGIYVLAFLFIQYIVIEVIYIAFEYFINMWAAETIHISNHQMLYILIGFILSMIVLDLFRSIWIHLFILQSTIAYSDKCIDKVIFAKIAYFDQNPTGRIVNRFSNDLKIIDLDLPIHLINLSRRFTLFIMCSVVIMINIPYALLPATILVILFFYIGKIYLSNSRELKRLSLISYSPIISTFTEVLGGLETIRALKLQNYFLQKIIKQLEVNSTIVFNAEMSGVWFYINAQLLLTTQTVIVIILSILMVKMQYLSPSIAVLGIVLQSSFSSYLHIIIFNMCNMEIDLTTIERLYHFYTMDNEFDDYYYNAYKHCHISNHFQSDKCGNVSFNGLTFKYGDNLPNVLQNVSFSVGSGESLGICGRTGSGKSSIFKCLLRLFDVKDNMVYVDGVDINRICLHDLRTNVSIIPQTPTVFSGTVRFNLDPFDKYEEKELINALKLCYLHPKYDLSFVAETNGHNMSQGEKQLLCIARCMLRNTKILLLDESTSNIDHESDQLIQKVIANNFKHCTILTIAHRLDTIMNSNAILVLEDGKRKQFDSPSNLFNDQNGIFYKLAAM